MVIKNNDINYIIFIIFLQIKFNSKINNFILKKEVR